jgi:hypothetical protein
MTTGYLKTQSSTWGMPSVWGGYSSEGFPEDQIHFPQLDQPDNMRGALTTAKTMDQDLEDGLKNVYYYVGKTLCNM